LLQLTAKAAAERKVMSIVFCFMVLSFIFFTFS
jgi:hypothetical protein